MTIFVRKYYFMKTLVSWIALANDFDRENNRVSPQSPNVNVHRFGRQKYEQHILLTTDKEADAKTNALLIEMQKTAPKCRFIHKPLDIADPYDFTTIIAKTDKVIQNLEGHDIDILFSNGTTIMRIVWYIIASESGFQMRLVQGIIKSQDPFISEFSPIKFSRAIPGKITVQKDESKNKIPRPKEETYALAKRLAAMDDMTVLIYGESGTGKEWLAKYIHANSARSDKRFIAVNCSALSDNLLESRLFGYKKGAFTDARTDKPGFFEEANDGVIFLDEIGDISPFMQQSLLRVLQEKKIMAVGDTKEKPINVRIVAATNRNLQKMVQEGNFREDLYFRLAESELKLPSLKEYDSGSIAILLEDFLRKFQFEGKGVLKLSPELKDFLISYAYPGNIREMEAAIKYLHIHGLDEVDMKHLPQRLQYKPKTDRLEHHMMDHCRNIYFRYGENYTKAANALGVSINTLKKYLAALQ